MITKYVVYKALRKHLRKTQISEKAVNEIHQFMNDSLNEFCKDLKKEFIENNKKRKIYGLVERKRIVYEFAHDFIQKQKKNLK